MTGKGNPPAHRLPLPLRPHAVRSATPKRLALARTCAWVMATASASAASACSRPDRPSITATMCCTCFLSAPPLPTRPSLISLAAYSLTGRSRATQAATAAPRACPSLSADIALLDRNTCSTATSSGAYCSISAHSPSSSLRRRSGKVSASSNTSGWWWTWLTRPSAATSMMPTPVRCEPGSMPRIRVMCGTPAGLAPTALSAGRAVSGDEGCRECVSRRFAVRAALAGGPEVGVGIHVLHVVHVLQPGQQLAHLLGDLAFHRRIVFGAVGDLGETRGQPRRLHRRLHLAEGLGRGDHVDRTVLRIHHDIVGAGLDRRLGDFFLVGAG